MGGEAAITVRMPAPTQGALQFEDDMHEIVAFAVLDDHSRIELDPSMGMRLSSLNTRALVVGGGNRTIVVPYNAVPHNGPLVDISWAPDGTCTAQHADEAPATLAAKTIALRVTPPAPEALFAAADSTLLVPSGDVAALDGAGYPTVGQISVDIKFASKVQRGMQDDGLVHFSVRTFACIIPRVLRFAANTCCEML